MWRLSGSTTPEVDLEGVLVPVAHRHSDVSGTGEADWYRKNYLLHVGAEQGLVVGRVTVRGRFGEVLLPGEAGGSQTLLVDPVEEVPVGGDDQVVAPSDQQGDRPAGRQNFRG